MKFVIILGTAWIAVASANLNFGFNSPFGGLNGGFNPGSILDGIEGFGEAAAGTFGFFGKPNRFVRQIRCKPEPLRSGNNARVESPRTTSASRTPEKPCGLVFSAYPIRITCPCFNIPDNAGCTTYFLEIRDQLNPPQRFCGTQVPRDTLTITSGVVQIYSVGGNYTCFVGNGRGWTRPSDFTCPPGISPVTGQPGTESTVSPSTTSSTGPTGTQPATVVPTGPTNPPTNSPGTGQPGSSPSTTQSSTGSAGTGPVTIIPTDATVSISTSTSTSTSTTPGSGPIIPPGPQADK